MRRVEGIIFAVLLGAPVAVAADGAPPPQVGPVSVDMSFEAARAALPAVAWKNEVSPYSGNVVAISAESAWTLEGQTYGVRLRRFKSGAALLSVWSEQPVKRGRECRKRVLALAAYFDSYFGALVSAEPVAPREWTPGSISVQRTPGGHPYAVATPGYASGPSQDTHRAAKNAIVGETEYKDDAIHWSFAQTESQGYGFAIVADAHYRPEGEDDEPAVCAIAADISKKLPYRLVPETLDTARVKPVAKTSAATLHHSIHGLDLPKQGVSVPMRCSIERTTGRVRTCRRDPQSDARSREEIAAAQRLEDIRFDPKQLDPDNDVPLEATFAVKLSPSDRRPEFERPRMPAAKPPVPLRTFNHVWARTATFGQLMALYPREALSKGIEGRVTATCVVQADLSIACTNLVNATPDIPAFEDAARRVFAYYRVEPLLRDGKSAVGTSIPLAIRFELE